MSILKKPVALAVLAAITLGVVWFGIRHFQSPAPVEKPATAAVPILAPEDQVHAKYAGSQACRECHAAAFGKWQHSNHGLAERNFSKEEDEKSFTTRQTLPHGKDSADVFVDADGVAKFLAAGPDRLRHNYKAARVIGNDPLRQFLVPAAGGRMQTFDISLDPAKNEWFDVYAGDPREPGDWGHWTGQGMNWNSMCAACHNTRLRKNFEPRTNSYHTSMAEMSVSCEACHGPMKDHVEWQKKPPLGEKKDPTLHAFTRDQVMETCAACHARRAELSGDLIPGESFYNHFSLTLPDETDTFYPDGQVHGEDYEFTAFVGSKMQHAGVRCADCHDPHTNQPIAPGNQLCMNCHAGGRADFPTAPVINPASHTHHGPESTGNQCVSCHMPVTTYMQRDPRHDHGFTIPDPRLTKEFNVPNACNRCHTDQSADWAVSAMKGFYGEKPDRPTHTRAVIIAKARLGDPAARDGLLGLLASEPIPSWRATACLLLERWIDAPQVAAALVKATADASPLVRESAARSLGASAHRDDPALQASLRHLLDDPVRSVRIAAAWASRDTVDLNSTAGRELVHMLDLHGDQPTGRMQLGQFAQARGDREAAIRQMKMAIAMDPNSPPFHHDLAVLLGTGGDAAGAVSAMREAVRLEPANPDYHFQLALALNEAGSTPQSLAEFETTVKLDPRHARAWYNLGLARSGMDQPQAAIQALRQAETADPSDASIPYARATIHARFGQKDAALAAVARALQLRPDFPEARQLAAALSR